MRCPSRSSTRSPWVCRLVCDCVWVLGCLSDTVNPTPREHESWPHDIAAVMTDVHAACLGAVCGGVRGSPVSGFVWWARQGAAQAPADHSVQHLSTLIRL